MVAEGPMKWDGRILAQVLERINESMNQRIRKLENQWTKKTMNHWINGSMIPWVNESMNFPTSSHKSSQIPGVCLRLLCENELLRYMLLLHSRNLQNTFVRFFLNRARARVSCTFCQPGFFKSASSADFFNSLKCKSSSRSPVNFVSATFSDRGPESRKRNPTIATLLLRPQEPNYPKTHRVSRPKVFSPVNSHAPGLFHFPTAWWWLVDMMVWMCVLTVSVTRRRSNSISCDKSIHVLI